MNQWGNGSASLRATDRVVLPFSTRNLRHRLLALVKARIHHNKKSKKKETVAKRCLSSKSPRCFMLCFCRVRRRLRSTCEV